MPPRITVYFEISKSFIRQEFICEITGLILCQEGTERRLSKKSKTRDNLCSRKALKRCYIIPKTKSTFVIFLVFLTASAPIIIVFAFYTSHIDFSDKMPVPNCETTLPCSLTSADLLPWKRAGIDQIIKQKNEFIFLTEQKKAEKNQEPFVLYNSVIDHFKSTSLGKLFLDPKVLLPLQGIWNKSSVDNFQCANNFVTFSVI